MRLQKPRSFVVSGLARYKSSPCSKTVSPDFVVNALVLTYPYVWKIPSGAFSDNQPIKGRCGYFSVSLNEYLIQFIEKLEQERYLQKFTITISHTYRRGHSLLRYRYMHCCSTIHSITYRYFWTQEGVPCTIFQICMLCIDSDIYSGYFTLYAVVLCDMTFTLVIRRSN